MNAGREITKFYWKNSDGSEFELMENEEGYDAISDLEMLYERFTDFLKACGFAETLVSRIKYLEPEQWKYIMQDNGEWKEDYENTYQF